MVGAECLVVVVGGGVVGDGAELGLRCGGGEELCTEFRPARGEFLCEPFGKGADVEFRRAVGDDGRDDQVAADGGDVDQLRAVDVGEVADEERGEHGQRLDVQVNHLPDLAEVLRADRAVAAEARIVDPCPEGQALHLVIDLHDAVGVRQVGRFDDDVECRMRCEEFLPQRIQPRGAARDEDEAVPARGERPRCGGADACARARDDGVVCCVLAHAGTS